MSATVQRIVETATEIFEGRPSWVTFFREVLGVDGLVRGACDTPEKLAELEATPQYFRLQAMLAELRARDTDLPGGPREPTRVITVRLPKCLHESLKAEAHDQHTSMNKLAITKLLARAQGPGAGGQEIPAAAEPAAV